MKTKILLLTAVTTLLMMTGCKDASVSIKEGTGTMKYGSASYTLNMSTITTITMEDGTYQHQIIFSNTSTDNIFSMTVVDKIGDNTITPGNYVIAARGDNTASFSIHGVAADRLAGAMKVTKSGKNYNFDFSGQTVDENVERETVTLDYSGALNTK